MSVTNPIHEILKQNKPFNYFHTHVLDRPVMDRILAAHKSFEIDISIDERGEPYVGHPSTYYSLRNLPPPTNLPLDQAVTEGLEAGLFIMLDVKNVKLLPKVAEIIQTYGSEHFIVHSFVKELSFKPYPPKVQALAEPHWPDEELPLGELLKLKQTTGVPLAVSCRGITQQRLLDEGTRIIDDILGKTAHKVDVVTFFMPAGEALPLAVSKKLLANGIIPLINVDHTPPAARPTAFFGSTDHLEQATTL